MTRPKEDGKRGRVMSAKNLIYYFSGTGNCLKVARDLAVALGESLIMPITESARAGENQEGAGFMQAPAGSGTGLFDGDFGQVVNIGHGQIGSADRIGFVYPVYFGGIPNPVRGFMKKLTQNLAPGALRDTYCFSIATYASLPFNGISDFAKAASDCGVQIGYATSLKMPGNYILLYGKQAKSDEILRGAEVDLLAVIDAVKDRQQGRPSGSNPLIGAYSKKMLKSTPGADRHYHVSDACTACGLCYAVCPVENIDMDDGKPVFSHHCAQCMACIQWCPVQAINYKAKTQARIRYRHPAVTAADMRLR